MTFNTGNPVGSTDARDLYDNAQNLDIFSLGQELEYPDRLGVARKSLAGLRQDVQDALSRLGYQVIGDYAAGLVIENFGQVFRKDGEFWRAKAALTLPYTLTGVWASDAVSFVSVGDAVLRGDLADLGAGAAIIGRGVVAVDSAADLLALPDGQRRADLRYLVRGYHVGSTIGGGEFYFDPSRSGEADGGLVLAGGWVRITDKVAWSHYGINSGTFSPSAFTVPWDSGLSKGFLDFELPAGNITLSGALRFEIPQNVTGPINIKHRGKISFNYAVSAPAPGNYLLASLIRFVGNGKVSVRADTLRMNAAAVTRPDNSSYFLRLVDVWDCPSSSFQLDLEDVHGFGIHIPPGSNGTSVRGKFYNCDGQNPTAAPGTSVVDNYGDAVYIGSANCIVTDVDIETTRGGRAGIVFEALSGALISGSVRNFRVAGYDRNIHVEGRGVKGSVSVRDGSSFNSHHHVWAFSNSPVYVENVSFENSATVSIRTQATSVVGYVCCYTANGADSKLITKDCTFKANLNATPRAVYSNSYYESDNDTFEDGSGSFNGAGIFKVDGSRLFDTRPVTMSGAKLLSILNCVLRCRVELPSSHQFLIENCIFDPYGEFCGYIVASNLRGGVIRNVRFNNPQTYCIGNFRSASVYAVPVFEGIIAVKTTDGSVPRMLELAPTGTSHDYRSSIPSYIEDRIAGTVTEIPVRLARPA